MQRDMQSFRQGRGEIVQRDSDDGPAKAENENELQRPDGCDDGNNQRNDQNLADKTGLDMLMRVRMRCVLVHSGPRALECAPTPPLCANGLPSNNPRAEAS